MARIEMVVTMTADFTYEAPCYGAPWRNETRHIYKMTGEDGRVFVWKTSSSMGKFVRVPDLKVANFTDKDGCPMVWHKAHKGDIIRIKATEGSTGTYKGEIETEISRVTVLDWIFKTETEDEKRARIASEKAAAKKALLDSVKDGDEIITMTYARFKKHYADCETVPDSFRYDKTEDGWRKGDGIIDVIVRAGRMKNSGVRGEHFKTYWVRFVDTDGIEKSQGYYAVSYGNAEKRCMKDYPGATGFEFDRVSHNSPKYID